MKNIFILRFFSCLLAITSLSAQDEEESADLFLDEYSVEFEEHFFEGLKQQSIRNYDRAVNSFLECKLLEPENEVIDYSLARAYFLNRQYIDAQNYAVDAVTSDSSKYWYLNLLTDILKAQGNDIAAVQNSIPFDEPAIQENLAEIYLKKERYEEARQLIAKWPNSKTKKAFELRLAEIKTASTAKTPVAKPATKPSENPITSLKLELESLLREGEYKTLEDKAAASAETYPLQPFFRYAHGKALLENNKLKQAVSVLKEAIDYVLDDISQSNSIYRALSKAYTQLGDAKKAAEYSNKIK